MDKSVSPVIFVYGMALVLGVSKACTLLIWHTLAKPRPGLLHELSDAWHHRTQQTSFNKTPDHRPGNQAPSSTNVGTGSP